MPAAIGLQRLVPDQLVLAVDGDGSFQMNMQELMLLRQLQLPVKILLFTARTLPLTGRLAPEAVASYLSGLLIGAEFSGALAHAEPTLPHVAIGDARLVDLYRTAAALIGLDLHAGPHPAAVDGLVALARALDILPGAAA